MSHLPKLYVFCAALIVAAASTAPAGVEIYLSQPQSQTVDASVIGAVTQDFNSAPTGAFTTLSSPVGDYTNVVAGKAVIAANSIYGGLGQGNYLTVSPGGTVSATLSTPAAYFGIFFTAADSSDTFTIYDAANVFLGSFSTQRLTTFLATPTVTALNGTVYNSSSYFGQPTAGGTTPTVNTSEAYVYLNLIATNGTKIGRVDFIKSSGGGFESDNHSLSATAPAPTGSFVDLGPVPEPGAATFFVIGALALGAILVRARQRQH